MGGTRIPISYPTPPPESPATAPLGPNSAGASVEAASEWVMYVCAHGRLPTRVAQGKGWTGPLREFLPWARGLGRWPGELFSACPAIHPAALNDAQGLPWFFPPGK